MSTSRLSTALLIPALALGLACESGGETVNPDEATPPTVTEAVTEEASINGDIDAILAADHRSADNSARDGQRHPKETLAFFGVTPSQTVVELWPGGGWYTEILAPLVRDEGKLIVTNYPTDGDPEAYQTKSGTKFNAKLADNPELYDQVEVVTVSDNLVLAPEGTADVVLTFRNSHGFFRDEKLDSISAAAFAALKSGGVYGVVQHRAADGQDAKKAVKDGYVHEKTIIESAEKAGFKLAEKSELNANPKDTKDHVSGVWSMAPNFSAGKEATDEQKAAHKAKYEGLGESDRMTLKFVKP
jgi:predicted methyltransferase